MWIRVKVILGKNAARGETRMTIVNTPDEEGKKLRKRELKKTKKTENWMKKRSSYGAGKVSKRTGQRRMEG